MAIRLKKIQAPQWQGNGFGTTSATWGIAGHEGWRLWQTGSGWTASHEGRPNVTSYTRALLVDKLTKILEG